MLQFSLTNIFLHIYNFVVISVKRNKVWERNFSYTSLGFSSFSFEPIEWRLSSVCSWEWLWTMQESSAVGFNAERKRQDNRLDGDVVTKLDSVLGVSSLRVHALWCSEIWSYHGELGVLHHCETQVEIYFSMTYFGIFPINFSDKWKSHLKS